MGGSFGRRQFLANGAIGIGCLKTSLLSASNPFSVASENASSIAPGSLQESDPSVFVFSRLKFQTIAQQMNEWDVMPQADDLLLKYVSRETNIRLSERSWGERVVGIDDFEKMYTVPFVFMTGEGDFVWTDAEIEALREFFKRGGFIFADDCVSPDMGDHFYQAYLRQIKKALPECEAIATPPDHEIYHCFFDISGGKAPYVTGKKNPDMGIFLGGRMVSFVTSVDQHCAWLPVFPSYRPLQEPCFKMSTNIIIYALTH